MAEREGDLAKVRQIDVFLGQVAYLQHREWNPIELKRQIEQLFMQQSEILPSHVEKVVIRYPSAENPEIWEFPNTNFEIKDGEQAQTWDLYRLNQHANTIKPEGYQRPTKYYFAPVIHRESR